MALIGMILSTYVLHSDAMAHLSLLLRHPCSILEPLRLLRLDVGCLQLLVRLLMVALHNRNASAFR